MELPDVISRYLEASNRFDADAAGDCFAMDALVHDEAADHQGRGAVRGWIAGTIEKYKPQLKVKEAREQHGKWILEVGVSGTFPGSPIALDYQVTVKDGLISGLVID